MTAALKKHIILILLTTLLITSCKTKKVFTATESLDCADFDQEQIAQKAKKKSKWRLVLYKDGEKVLGKSKKTKKSKLFNHKK
tara:strand:- start:181 stop:429 length:249 start_codon:yes stop_codon:yes gene_type:complete